jgi:hypothetical protein
MPSLGEQPPALSSLPGDEVSPAECNIDAFRERERLFPERGLIFEYAGDPTVDVGDYIERQRQEADALRQRISGDPVHQHGLAHVRERIEERSAARRQQDS